MDLSKAATAGPEQSLPWKMIEMQLFGILTGKALSVGGMLMH